MFVFTWWVTRTVAIAKPCRLCCCWWWHFFPYERNGELTQVFVFTWWVTGTMAIAKPCHLYCWWRHFSPYERNTELTQVPGVCVHVVGDGNDGHCQTIPLILLVATFSTLWTEYWTNSGSLCLCSGGGWREGWPLPNHTTYIAGGNISSPWMKCWTIPGSRCSCSRGGWWGQWPLPNHATYTAGEDISSPMNEILN